MGVKISLVFYKVSAVVLILHQKIVITPNNSELLDSCIVNDAKYFPNFKNCLGVLDGTYLSAHPPAIIASPYRN